MSWREEMYGGSSAFRLCLCQSSISIICDKNDGNIAETFTQTVIFVFSVYHYLHLFLDPISSKHFQIPKFVSQLTIN